FTWNQFCDWYIELAKETLYGSDPAARQRTQTVLFFVLENLLRLLHPFIPFITEEIWQALPGERPLPSLMLASYPDGDKIPTAEAEAAKMELLMEVIKGIRNIRGEMNVPPAKKIAAVLDCRTEAVCAVIAAGEPWIRALARLEHLAWGCAVERPRQAATQVTGEVEILLPLAGMIDLDEEEKRLRKELAKAEKDVRIFDGKLANADFVAKAPPEVLEKNREKLKEARDKMAVLEAGLEKILALK
ncbi:MAG: class I tRNA ligase family protein, partial [Deltaproteobacteria bacterium]|nr:class I tRNA ligase family protein [Deltaproteobacteria bacterium]